MAADFVIAIVGSGPAGMSAAAHAAKLGVSHVLLERTPHSNDTIYKFQKRKLVMATPEFLPLRSDLIRSPQAIQLGQTVKVAVRDVDEVHLFHPGTGLRLAE